MKTKGNQRRDSVARILRRNMDNAAFAGAHYPNCHIEIEAACRNGVSRQIATTYYNHKYKKSPRRGCNHRQGQEKNNCIVIISQETEEIK